MVKLYDKTSVPVHDRERNIDCKLSTDDRAVAGGEATLPERVGLHRARIDRAHDRINAIERIQMETAERFTQNGRPEHANCSAHSRGLSKPSISATEPDAHAGSRTIWNLRTVWIPFS